MLFQCASEHVLIEGRVEGQHHAVGGKLHEAEQGLGRRLAGGQLAGGDAVDQHGLVDLDLAAQGAFELLGHVDGAVLDGDRADRDDDVAVEVQAGGFQVEHHEALLVQ
ncbi:hypothetical protein D3C86_1497710 [compost metagenome]